MSMICRPVVAALVAAGMLGGAAGVYAAPNEPALASPLTFDEAIAIALEAQPGKVAEVALDRAQGKVVIDIEVVNEAGDEVEFMLDAATGEILFTKVDDDPSDDPGEGENDEY